ncbi:MAG: sensor histidine kinase [Paludibacter sp.]|nr:sensor histidine kinase [Paludibacter sp.]
MNKESNILKWRFDVSTFRLIGRDLITDRITALFELVKNCYDANSTSVDIVFENISSINPKSKIIIRDNGCGMAFSDIRDKWMVIGTASKRNTLYSEAPFNRRYVGEKGIGRFAVDKLGDKVNIKTKQKGNSQLLNVEINWELYNTKSNNGQLTLFTDIENTYSYENSSVNFHGTILEISEIREIWTTRDIERLYKELTKIVSPFYPLNPPFDIYISSNEYDAYTRKLVSVDVIQFSSHNVSISFNAPSMLQETLYFDKDNGILKTKNIPLKNFGGINMKMYFFNEAAKRAYRAKFKNDDTRIDGIKIYRDGIITTPFAEFESHQDKKRDILGIDKRLWRDIFNRVSTREIIGIVEITKDGNPNIIDATNRQDFVENNQYKQLKEFIIEQLDVFTELKKYERIKNKATVADELKLAKNDVNSFVMAIDEITKQNPALEAPLKPLKEQAKQVSSTVSKGIAEQKKAEKEFLRKENIYLSLMSLQDYAANMSHAVRTSLGRIKDKAEFFKIYYPDPSLEEFFKLYSREIYEDMMTLNKVISYMLSYAGSNIPFEDLDVKKLIEGLFYDYNLRFENEKIKSIIEIKDNFIINANKQFFSDIFQNLIDNSVKALVGNEIKIIKCSGYIENNQFLLFFSDNGVGIEEENKEKVFELYHTSTAEQGGSGLGLYIVKTRIEALKGKVEVIENEFLPTGATFKITLPFKK